MGKVVAFTSLTLDGVMQAPGRPAGRPPAGRYRDHHHHRGDHRHLPHREEPGMRQYLLTIYQPDGPPPPPEDLERIMADIDALNREIEAAGAWVFAGGLHPPSTATVLRAQGEEVLVTDGPYAEGKEHVGGFTIVKAPDLDAALEWGRKLARVITLPIEVRPFQGEVED